MSLSYPKPESTKAGVALTADARHKLQQLANWIELEASGQQDPQVQFAYWGGIVACEETKITYMSPIGALVQMFQPFKLSDAKALKYGLHVAPYESVTARAAEILGLCLEDLREFRRYIHRKGYTPDHVVAALRILK